MTAQVYFGYNTCTSNITFQNFLTTLNLPSIHRYNCSTGLGAGSVRTSASCTWWALFSNWTITNSTVIGFVILPDKNLRGSWSILPSKPDFGGFLRSGFKITSQQFALKTLQYVPGERRSIVRTKKLITSQAGMYFPYHTFSPRQKGWFFVFHMADKLRGPPERTARYLETKRLQHHWPYPLDFWICHRPSYSSRPRGPQSWRLCVESKLRNVVCMESSFLCCSLAGTTVVTAFSDRLFRKHNSKKMRKIRTIQQADRVFWRGKSRAKIDVFWTRLTWISSLLAGTVACGVGAVILSVQYTWFGDLKKPVRRRGEERMTGMTQTMLGAPTKDLRYHSRGGLMVFTFRHPVPLEEFKSRKRRLPNTEIEFVEWNPNRFERKSLCHLSTPIKRLFIAKISVWCAFF